jgi:serine/threonine protein kinase
MKIFRPENLLLDDASHVKIADFGKKKFYPKNSN